MSPRTAKLAWSLWGLCATLTLGAVILAFLGEPAPGEGTNRFVRVSLDVALLAFPTVGALIASRRSGNPIGWLLAGVGVGGALSAFAAEYGVRALLTDSNRLPGGTVAAWVGQGAFTAVIAVAFTLVLLLFPHGRLLSRRWRPVAWLAVLAGLLLSLGIALKPGRFGEDPFVSVENPAGVDSGKVLFDTIEGVGWVLFLVVVLASAVSLVLRFRRVHGEEREQMKWIAGAAVLLVGLWFVAFIAGPENANIQEAMFSVGFAVFPVSIGFAILEHRLYEIDRIINRALVYGVLTGGLAGLYFGIVIGLQAAFSSFTRGNDLAIAGSTLAVAALFRPARTRVQEFVERRFYRRRYDAQRTLEGFASLLRDEVDLDALAAQLGLVVASTMEPRHVSVWLREARR